MRPILELEGKPHLGIQCVNQCLSNSVDVEDQSEMITRFLEPTSRVGVCESVKDQIVVKSHSGPGDSRS